MIAAASGRVVASAPAIMWRTTPIRMRSPPHWRRVDGAAAEFERGGLVADEKRDRGRPDEVDGALIAERGAELAAFAQAGAGLAGIGFGDGRADGEQAGRDQGRGADLAGQRECLARQRDGCGRVTGEQVIARGDAELDGGVGEVAAGPRDDRRPVRRGGRRQRTRRVVTAMFERAAQMVSSTRQSGVSRRALASAARRHSSSAPVTSARMEANTALTARASG